MQRKAFYELYPHYRPWAIAYNAIGREAVKLEPAGRLEYLQETLQAEWFHTYKEATGRRTNLHDFTNGGYTFLYDLQAELVDLGEVEEELAAADRVVSVFGLTRQNPEKRKDSILRGWPRGRVDELPLWAGYDRGHFIAHILGGSLHVNIFTQARSLNRGWSEEGKRFRALENLGHARPGALVFARPLYLGRSAHPAALEYGVISPDAEEVTVELFLNEEKPGDLEKIEAYYDGGGEAPEMVGEGDGPGA